MTGKGSQRRPMAVSAEEFARNWERTFGHVEPIRPLGFAANLHRLARGIPDPEDLILHASETEELHIEVPSA